MKNDENNDRISAEVIPEPCEIRDEILAEYSALRNEILKLIGIRNQLMTFSLIVAGTILTFGAKKDVTVLVLLLYPILAFFLALTWVQTDVQIGNIGYYIRTHIEKKLKGLKWETFYYRERTEGKTGAFSRRLEISAAGVFLTTEVLSVLLAFKKLDFSIKLKFEYLFLLLDVISIILTIFYIGQRRKKGKWGYQDPKGAKT